MKTFSYDAAFLNNHLTTVLLQNGDSGLLVCPELQGRVLTSTACGENGRSYGWINYALIRSGKYLPHCNNFGGEDRFWIGPEGGQFSVFFSAGAPFDLENWQTPPAIDTESWTLVSNNAKCARFEKTINLVNYSGNTFLLHTDREVVLHTLHEVQHVLGTEIPSGVKTVGFYSSNKITNIGNLGWNHKTGMISIWILGQFTPSYRNTVIIPFKANAAGIILNDRYFGKVESERLRLHEQVILFKGDGQKRGKVGLAYGRAKQVIGSYDPIHGVLTIVKYSFDPTKTDYVNSMWEHQENPYKGDVVNAYNDGPLPDGTIMGPFYELESSSSAASLMPGEFLTHVHTTCHFEGDHAKLNVIAKAVLGISIDECF
jgi:hypothetical protein